MGCGFGRNQTHGDIGSTYDRTVATEPGLPTAPTAFPELNRVLDEVVARVTSILGENFVGAYLVGSFALGAGEIHSDCDFLVVTDVHVSAEQEQALREFHDELPTRTEHWARHLEGSYAPRQDLSTLAALGTPWLYIDHGWREMQWSNHCNREEVRWTLRARGIPLAGPDPAEFVCEVPPDVLRDSMRRQIGTFMPDLLSWISFDAAWTQRYAVTSLCRMLYTVDSGEVASKPAALQWAKQALPPAWHGLIQQTFDDRSLGWDPDDPPRPGSVEATIEFARYAAVRVSGSLSQPAP
jgi:hypothetical protein